SVDSIMVKVGDKVKKGDRLMIYEAMKMKNVISAPFEAIIETIDVKVGDKLPEGARLILLRN
ncbi:MAG: acetyl-CoA carboxylase biotin carboxyl carrier protein subunit, partial [Bacteroidales bacterium]